VTNHVLIIGATGMLGHKLVQHLSERFTVTATIRGSAAPGHPAAHAAIAGAALVCNVDVEDAPRLATVIGAVAPDVVINAVGIVKQLEAAKDPLPSIAINALLPHQIAMACRALPRPARLIHLSTDCVFSGRGGPYQESDFADADDLYGRTKLLGEVTGQNCLTLRSSIIGRELRNKSGLVEWFMGQRGGKVRGFTRALYTGLTTIAMASLIGDLIEHHPELQGLWQVASAPIDKYQLLQLLNRHFDLGIAIAPDEAFFCDRRLDGSRFAERTGFRAKPWGTMIAEMRADPTPYD
jgi:dTDP-4-dehydrorhamnose reductase